MQMLADCSEGKIKVFNEDIMKFNIPAAFPKMEGVEWEKHCKYLRVFVPTELCTT